MNHQNFFLVIPGVTSLAQRYDSSGDSQGANHAGDALHLAVVKLDKMLLKAGRILGLPVSASIRRMIDADGILASEEFDFGQALSVAVEAINLF